MTNKKSANSRAQLINSIRTPLGFFTLIALILDGILVAATTQSDELPLWMPLAVLALLIVLVYSIVLIKPVVLYGPSAWMPGIRVTLAFPDELINLDVDRCMLEIRNKEGRKKRTVTPAPLTLEVGGWVVRLADIEPSDSVRLELTDDNGTRWQVPPFIPYETERRVIEGRN